MRSISGGAQTLIWHESLLPGDKRRMRPPGLASLQHHDSMHALLEAYYAPHDAEPTDWVELACRSCQADHILNRGIVEDVAYARRAQQLITEAIGETS
jgi:hypothetical protein